MSGRRRSEPHAEPRKDAPSGWRGSSRDERQHRLAPRRLAVSSRVAERGPCEQGAIGFEHTSSWETSSDFHRKQAKSPLNVHSEVIF